MTTGVSSAVVALSLLAVGAGLVIVQVKVRLLVNPPGSVAVTVTEYTPPFGWLAFLSIVPLMMPVVGLIERPAGRFVVLNDSVSPQNPTRNC